MKNFIPLFLCVAVSAIVAPIFLIGFEPRLSNNQRLEAQAAEPSETVFEFEMNSTEEVPESDALSIGGQIAGDPKPEKDEVAVRVPILMYHHVREMRANFSPSDRLYTVTPESFETQMHQLVEAGYHTITPDQLAQALVLGQKNLPTKPVLITLDDGFRDQYENAFPILQKYHLSATFFIVSEAHKLHGNMNNEMIKELDQAGMTIAAHTQHHAFLTRHSAAKQWEEIEGSKKDLEALLGRPVTSFAYPYGSWSPSIIEQVKNAGFALGFWVRSGSLHVNSSRYMLRRLRVTDKQLILPLLERYSVK